MDPDLDAQSPNELDFSLSKLASGFLAPQDTHAASSVSAQRAALGREGGYDPSSARLVEATARDDAQMRVCDRPG